MHLQILNRLLLVSVCNTQQSDMYLRTLFCSFSKVVEFRHLRQNTVKYRRNSVKYCRNTVKYRHQRPKRWISIPTPCKQLSFGGIDIIWRKHYLLGCIIMYFIYNALADPQMFASCLCLQHKTTWHVFNDFVLFCFKNGRFSTPTPCKQLSFGGSIIPPPK